ATVPLAAQEKLDPETVAVSPERMNAFLVREAERVSREAWERIDSKEKLERERPALQREFMFSLGLDPLPERGPLDATVVRTIDRPGYTVEVLHFQSLPGFYCTANLYRPKKGRPPFPAVLECPGHSADEYGAKALRQDYDIPWVRAGYVVLMIDPIQVAEVFGVHRGTHAWDLYDWFARGYTPIGIEVWNAMRGVDYLLGRADVDGKRLTINGVSGGGHLSWMAGAADDRIAVVQPVAGTSTISTHVALDLQRMACDCAYFINTFRLDWTSLAGIIAPRPLKMYNSTDDHYYPPPGYEEVDRKAETIYAWYGHPERTGMFVVPGPHDYYRPEREEAVAFSERMLFGRKRKIQETAFDTIPREQLAALGGQHAAKPANINDRIQDLLIPAAQLGSYTDRAAWEGRRAEVLQKLGEWTFRNMPKNFQYKVAATGGNGAVALETEPGILAGLISYVPQSDGPKQNAVLYVAAPGETEDMGIWNFMKAYPFKGYAGSRHMVFPRGIGTQVWNGNDRRKFERDAMLIGRSVAEMRIYDILCAVDYLCGQSWYSGKEFTLVGKGEQAVLAAYAALLDPRITRVIVKDPPLSHREGAYLLNVLRTTDIPEAFAMLAPRELDFITDEIRGFDFTRGIYGLYGADKQMRRVVTVAQALNLPPE
ncbi:alpha/beta hydrolase family protein, partial [bacterium]|nr:alpha/beta hydrolase family protein [bacterium]